MKSSKKFAKLISVILLVSMLLTSNSVGVWADGLEWEEPESQTDLQENPYGEQAAENTVWEFKLLKKSFYVSKHLFV